MIRDVIRIWGTVFAALLGLAFGSFLNVCLSRWPRGESIIKPRSHCRTCGRVLPWWENVPLLSWVALRGKCRGCGAWIGWRHLIVEAAIGGLWAAVVWSSLPSVLDADLPGAVLWYQLATVFAKMMFLWLLAGLAVLDAEYLWLPDAITMPGIVVGLVLGILKAPIVSRLSASSGLPLSDGIENSRYGIYTPALELLIGAVGAFVLILVIRWIYWLIRRREGIGLGDAKLMALLAAWLGFPRALLAFGVGAVLGAVMAVVVVSLHRKRGGDEWGLLKLPLGTFLCIGGMVSSLWGREIIAAYLRWAGL
jgi:leader peptidase (prepilin peptidase)/N-methyltransferase